MSLSLASNSAIIAFLLGYLAGSIPFGLLLTRAFGHKDIRRLGSGNIGATNVLRTGHRGLALLTLLADILKGTLGVLVAADFGYHAALLAGLGAFLGHLFPVWLNFRGGKGVATYIGVLLGLHWPFALLFCSIWLTVALLFRISSLAALVAAAVLPVAVATTGQKSLVFVVLVMSVLVFVKHRTNIRRLLDGQEDKIGGRGKP